MGLLKRMKTMHHAIELAPGVVAQVTELGAQEHQLALARQAAMQSQLSQVGQMGGQAHGMQPRRIPRADAAGREFGAVAGVSLEEFAAVSKGLAAFDDDQSKVMNVAAAYGIDTFTWELAARGWNDRIRSDPAVAQRFRQLYLAA